MMRYISLSLTLAAAGCARVAPVPSIVPDLPGPPESQEAPAAFDSASNGIVDDATHKADRTSFDEIEEISDGLGPLYNAQSCRECHQNPQSGGGSQVTEVRVGHRDRQGRFVTPSVPIAGGTVTITERSLINDRAICPSAAFPDQEIQERIPSSETIRTLRISVSLLGDGFVEAVPDETLHRLAAWQCRETKGRICGKAISVPVLEAPGTYGVGRFGWKNQQASLLSFAADAYLNEMGITNRLRPTEVTTICDTVKDPEDKPRADGLSDIDRFARFIRATKAPPRDVRLAATAEAKEGSALFDAIGCAICHVRTLVTAPPGTSFHGGTFILPPALGNKAFHPYSDYLLHDVGTGDGIVIAVFEHHGPSFMEMQPEYDLTAPRVRTAPLWGGRTRSRHMHDGQSLTLRDAILRHGGEAADSRSRFAHLGEQEKEQLLAFLRSL
jgi:CxxC motif-containing protein (DUF1111 family)